MSYGIWNPAASWCSESPHYTCSTEHWSSAGFINSAYAEFLCICAKDLFIWGLASLQTALLQEVKFITLEAALLVFRTHLQVHMTHELLTYLPILLHIFLLKLNKKWQKCRNICVLHSVNITAKIPTLACQLTIELCWSILIFLTSSTCSRKDNSKYTVINSTIKCNIYLKHEVFCLYPPDTVSVFSFSVYTTTYCILETSQRFKTRAS